MAASWYYAHDEARKGPVSRDDLRFALGRGEIDRQSMVWCEGMPQWQALESVEELQLLLEGIPPTLPPTPPPLPSAPPPLPSTPAAAGTPADGTPADGTPADAQDRSRAGDERSEPAQPRRGETVKSVLGDWFVNTVKWLGGKIANALWGNFRWQVIGCISAPLIVVGGYYVVKYVLRDPPPPAAMGQVRIDANPWGRIDWIRGPTGKNIDLSEGRTTPFVATLPIGNYKAQVGYPHTETTDQCDLRVRPEQVATCWLDLAPVDANAYFQKLGW